MTSTKLLPARRMADQFDILKYQVVNAFLDKCGRPFVVAFTSCEPGEGVTSITVNFAASLISDRKNHILLVDGNLARPGLHEYFISNGNCREDKIPVNKEDKEVEIINWQVLEANPYLDVILACQLPSHANRAFKMSEFSDFLRFAKEKYEIVVIDCPPLNHSSGAAVIASRADAVVLVVEAERVRREVIQRSVNMLEGLGANMLGVVLNKRRYPIPKSIYKML